MVSACGRAPAITSIPFPPSSVKIFNIPPHAFNHSALLIPRFFVTREDFVPRASCPCRGTAWKAVARFGF
jgi:hypothetical protein